MDGTSLRHRKKEYVVTTRDRRSGHGLPEGRTVFRLPPRRSGKIALEEIGSSSIVSDVELRLAAMKSAGVGVAVVAHTVPGIETISDTHEASDAATRANDRTRTRYTSGQHADRFRAFGCVAMQDAEAAAAEAERCVNELGFVGILINGYAHLGEANAVRHLDEPQYEPFWAKLAELDVPSTYIPGFRRPVGATCARSSSSSR